MMFKKLILFQYVLMFLVLQRIVETKNLKVTDFCFSTQKYKTFYLLANLWFDLFFFFCPLFAAYEISVPQPGIEPRPLVVTAWSPYHWILNQGILVHFLWRSFHRLMCCHLSGSQSLKWCMWHCLVVFVLGLYKMVYYSLCKIRRHLLLGRKAMTNLVSVLKSRDITLLTKVHLVKAMIFPVVMYGCENWTIKKAECRRIDAFELWCWRRLLRVPWTARISNQSILKEINPKYSLEGLMLKLKLQYFGHLMRRADSLEKTLMLGKIGGRRRRGRQRTRWLDGIPDSMDMSLSGLREAVKDCRPWEHKVSYALSNWAAAARLLWVAFYAAVFSELAPCHCM